MNHGGKQKRLTYWYAELSDGDVTLQEALHLALSVKRKKAKDRIEALAGESDDDRVLRFVNRKPSLHHMQCGELVMIDVGAQAQAVIMGGEEEEFDLIELAASAMPDANGDAGDKAGETSKKEFLTGALYFAVLDNHVIISGGRSVTARDLEPHLNWLLIESEAIEAGGGLHLRRELSETARNRVASEPPGKIRVGTPLWYDSPANDEPTNSSGADGGDPKPSSKTTEFTANALGRDVMRLLLGKQYDDISANNTIDPESIKVYVEVSFKRKKSEAAQSIMRSMTTALRHIPEDDISYSYSKTGRIKGGKLFLEDTFNVNHVNNVVDAYSMWSTMHSWLQHLLSKGLV